MKQALGSNAGGEQGSLSGLLPAGSPQLTASWRGSFLPAPAVGAGWLENRDRAPRLGNGRQGWGFGGHAELGNRVVTGLGHLLASQPPGLEQVWLWVQDIGFYAWKWGHGEVLPFLCWQHKGMATCQLQIEPICLDH